MYGSIGLYNILAKVILEYSYDRELEIIERVDAATIKIKKSDNEITEEDVLCVQCVYYDLEEEKEIEYIPYLLIDIVEEGEDIFNIPVHIEYFLEIINEIVTVQPNFVGLKNSLIKYIEKEKMCNDFDENRMMDEYDVLEIYEAAIKFTEVENKAPYVLS